MPVQPTALHLVKSHYSIYVMIQWHHSCETNTLQQSMTIKCFHGKYDAGITVHFQIINDHC